MMSEKREFRIQHSRFRRLKTGYRILSFVSFMSLLSFSCFAADIDKDALRRAIDDLAVTYPDKYSNSAELIARLVAVTNQSDFAVLQREVMLSNPLLDFDKLLVVKRNKRNLGLPQNWQGNCALKNVSLENEIAVLDIKSGKTEVLFKPEKQVFVGDVDLHFDADRMLLSMPDDKGNWQIWEIGADGKGLKQLTPDEPPVDHYDACYLPDGGILFNSTAVMTGVPCVGGGNQVANIFKLDAEGKIRRLCFDQEHNWCPTVLNDGRILYTRWEYTDTPHYFTRLLFTMNPDGTGQAAAYGSNSYWPNSVFYARPIPGQSSRLVGIVSGHHGVARMGELYVFDPAIGRFESEGAVRQIPGFGKKIEPKIQDGLVEASWPKFLHPYPLSDKYFITACKPNAGANWGIYLVDIFDNMVLLADDTEMALLEPIPFRKTVRPPVLPDRVNLDKKDATVYMADVYSGPGLAGVPRGTIKNLRIYSYHFAYPGMGGHINIGIDGPWDVRRIIGTVPVKPDGSAAFKVPANMPIAVQPLDDKGRAVQIMRSWFTAMPGEVLSCVGCHEKQNTVPPAKLAEAMREAPREITPWHGPMRGFSFSREVQPVLDKNCAGCHKEFASDAEQSDVVLKGKKGKVRTAGFTKGYVNLHPFVRRPGPESDYHIPKPYEYHVSTSFLFQMLEKGHMNVALDAEAWDRLTTWIDLNVPDHGTWGDHRPVPGGYDIKRKDFLKKYAGMDDDPEIYPTPDPVMPEFVKPAPVKAIKPEKKDWSLDMKKVKGLKECLSFDIGVSQKMEMVLVPAGNPYYIGKYEVKNSEYTLFDGEHESGYLQIFNKDRANRGVSMVGSSQPAARVKWEDAGRFCDWLSKKTGRKFTLPSEFQWEFACRAGSQTPMWYGKPTDDFGKLANFADSSLSFITTRDSPKWLPVVNEVDDDSVATAAVGKYKPNGLGLYDMQGNVWEWTSAESGGKAACKGGSFYDRPARGAADEKLLYEKFQPVFDVGFRVVCEVKDEDKK